MKRINIFISLLALSFSVVFNGCESLDQYPEDYFSGNSFWKDATQVDGYMTGLHTMLRGSYPTLFSMGELRGGLLGDGDDGKESSVFGESLSSQTIIKQDLRADNAYFGPWNGLYANIVRVNLAINEIPNLSFLSDDYKQLYLGQAYGIRAFYYYLLYATWGGVPLVTDVQILKGRISAAVLSRPRAKASEIMTLIKSDIDASEKAFTTYGKETFRDHYKWNKYATLMLKANVYTFAANVTIGDQQATGSADLQTAKTALQEIINSSKFELNSEFHQAFRSDYKRNNKELIFSVPFNKTDKVYMPFISSCLAQSNFFTAAYGLDNKKLKLDNSEKYGTNTLINGIVRYQYKETFWRSFDEKDTRRDQTFFPVKTDPKSEATGSNFGVLLKKFSGTYYTDEGVHRFDADGPVFRYAEALLLMAEVENDLGNDPSTYINQIRERAYGKGYPVYANRSKYENTQAILSELDKEFVFEGKRWFALLRMKSANGKSLVFDAAVNYPFIRGVARTPILPESEAYKMQWPVSVGTMTNDPAIKQTPGYE